MATEINQEEVKEFYQKGVLAFEKQNYDYAIEIFSQILSSKYDHLESRHYLHTALKNKKANYKPSLVTNLINDLYRILVSLSVTSSVKKGKVTEALEGLEKVLSNNPYDTDALKMMADIFYKQNLIQHAVQTLEEAKSINPKDINIFKRLGEIYSKMDDYKNAKLNYEGALSINANDREVLQALKNLDALGTIQRDFGS